METKIWQINPLRTVSQLLYPNTCAACGKNLTKQEEIVCLLCELELPQTNFHQNPNNPVTRLLQGSIPIKQAAAFYYFHKSSEVQQLIHHLKYSNWPEIGTLIGSLYGKKLKDSSFKDANVIVPVPLHPRKRWQRGYNQSEMFAQGLSQTLNIPLDNTSLIRQNNTESQTKKSGTERSTSAKGFVVTQKEQLANKHILLVDDVITTGSTIRDCVKALLEAHNITISVASIAVTQE